MRPWFLTVGLIAALTFCGQGAHAQSSTSQGGVAPNSMGTSGLGSRGVMNQEQFNKLQEYSDLAKRLNSDKSKTVEQLLAEDKAMAASITAAMPLACEVEKAAQVAEGPETSGGRTVQTKTIETVCTNGMGYFLVSRDGGANTGITCFAADAARTVDLAAGHNPGIVCGFHKELADPKMIIAVVLSHAGISCTVRDYRYIGQNAAARLEFEEAACGDNSGYVVTAALPGLNSPVRIMNCHDSAMRGLPCKLSDNGTVVTIRTFKDELARKGVMCDASVHDVRVLGQEPNLKRYVVEFRCTQHQSGLVAYIPFAGVSKAPFEVIDCIAASKRGAKCALTPSR